LATNRTDFLGLNSWVGTDPVRREEINDNFDALDGKAKEHDDKLGGIGDLTGLQTTNKTDLVSAVNEQVTNVGDLTTLQTTEKGSVVGAVNEHATQLAQNVLQIQDISINVKHPPTPLTPAKADGITDDSGAIQAIINYAVSLIQTTVLSGSQTVLGAKISFPSGVYLFKNKISINTSTLTSSTKVIDAPTIVLEGLSRNNVVFKADASLSGEVIDLVNGIFDISNIKMIGNANAKAFRLGRTTLNGTSFQAISSSKFSNIRLFNFNVGFSIEIAWDCSFFDINYGSPLGTNPVAIDVLAHATDNTNNLNFWRCHFEPSYTGNYIRAVGVSGSTTGYHHGFNFYGCHFETRSFATTIFNLKAVRFVRLNNCQLSQNNDASSGATLSNIVPMFMLNDVTIFVLDSCEIGIVVSNGSALSQNMFDLAGQISGVKLRDCGVQNGVNNTNNSVDSLWQSNATTPFTPISGQDALVLDGTYINNFYNPWAKNTMTYLNSRTGKNKKWVQQYDETTNNLQFGYGSGTGDLTNTLNAILSTDGMLRSGMLSSTYQTTVNNASDYTFTMSYNNNPNKRGVYLVVGDDSTGQVWALIYSTGSALISMLAGTSVVVQNAQGTTASKLTVYLNGTNIAVNNALGANKRVLLLPIGFY
jgi:hypothetical protein